MFHIYKASAGSGKTFTLAKQYLKLLLGYKDPDTGEWSLRSGGFDAHRHILAITFTNKATQEMMRRIVDELAHLAGMKDRADADKSPVTPSSETTAPDGGAASASASASPRKAKRRKALKPSPYLKDFCDDFDATPDEIAEAARKALFALLFDFGFFHVSTIDAFFQTVLRTFAREIEVADNFEIELDNRFAINMAINEMFESLNRRDEAYAASADERRWLKSWIMRLMDRMLADGKSINLFARNSGIYAELVSAMTGILNEKYKLNRQAIDDYILDKSRLEQFEKAVEKQVDDHLAQLTADAARLTAYGDFATLKNSYASPVNKWAAGEFAAPTDAVVASIDNPSARYRKEDLKRGISETFDSAVTDLYKRGIEQDRLTKLLAVVREGLGRLGVLAYMLQILSSLCKENNTIMLSETNSLLHEIINLDDTPFIYERMGFYLRHFLIDEFQDTSRMQWDNMRPLLLESIANLRDNLIIGDEKQCIYRFRNSDPELLGNEVEAEISGRSGSENVEVSGSHISQNTNWRSSVDVVKFNNTIFRALAEVVDAGIEGVNVARATYHGVVQQIPDKHSDLDGYVRLQFFERGETSDETPDEDADDSIKETTEKNAAALDAMVENIGRQLASGYRPKDIAILVRTHTEGEAVINRLLAEADNPDSIVGRVPVTSTDSMNVSAAASVKLIISILRMAITPPTVFDTRDGRTPREIINPVWRRTALLQKYEYYLHTPTEPDADGVSRPHTPDEALRKAVESIRLDGNKIIDDAIITEIAAYAKGQTTRSNALASPSLDIVVERIISKLPKQTLARENIFLTAFRDLVHDFIQHGSADIRSFLRWWDNGGNTSGLATSAEVDAINVMTIHKSKGLEFPCVIIPFANWKMVTWSSIYQPSYDWYSINPACFPAADPECVPPFLPLNNHEYLTKIPVFASQSREFTVKQSVDALNVAYVGFTRAVRELIVFSTPTDDTNRLGYDLMKAVEMVTGTDFLENAPEETRRWLTPFAYDESTRTLTVGAPTVPRSDEEEETAEDADSTEAEEEATPAPPDQGAIDVVSSFTNSYVPGINDDLMILSTSKFGLFDFADSKRLGTFLHGIMSGVRHASELDLAVRRAAYRAKLSDRQRQWVSEVLSKALRQTDAVRWFADDVRVFNETPVSCRGEEHRPDRVVLFPDGSVEIVDYKFGHYDERHLDGYKKQVAGYVDLLRRVGYDRVTGYLWYPLTGEIKRV